MTRFPTPPERVFAPSHWKEDLPAAFSADDLRTFARTCPDVRMRGYLLMIASVYEGAAPEDIARIWSVNTTILEQALRRFAEEGIQGLSDHPQRSEKTSRLGGTGQ